MLMGWQVRGVNFYHEGNIVKTYAGGLGIGINNQAKIFAFCFGLKLYVEVGVCILIVIADSLLVLSQVK